MTAFGPEHYVPVLKVKQGEKRALVRLTRPIARRTTPLLEIVERTAKPGEKPGDPDVMPTLDEHFATSFKGFEAAVGGFDRYFLDCRELLTEGSDAVQEAFDRAAAIGRPFTPVTSVLRGVDKGPALAHRTHGIALRLSLEEFHEGRLATLIPDFLKQHDVRRGEVDMIVDLGAVDQMIDVGVLDLAQSFLADVPDQDSWRTLTLSACAFPASMGVVDKNSHKRVDRIEWRVWRDSLHRTRKKLVRLPTFSDCCVQHRSGVEDYDPRTMPASAAIRFTERDSWLLAKGESLRITGGKIQFPQLAAKIASNVYGGVDAAHCDGCDGLNDSKAGVDGFGSLQKWRELGTIHHITRTVESLAELPFP